MTTQDAPKDIRKLNVTDLERIERYRRAGYGGSVSDALHSLGVNDTVFSYCFRPLRQGMQLVGTSITDQGMLTLATGFPRLRGINVESCRLVTERGFLSLTNSKTITDVGLSLQSFSQAQIENIISTVSNVTWWTISDPGHKLDSAPVRALGESRKVTIHVADENNSVKSITSPQRDGPANGSQPVRSDTNQTSSAAGSGG